MAGIYSSWEYISDTELAPKYPPLSRLYWETQFSGQEIFLVPLPVPLPPPADFWQYQDDDLVPRSIPKTVDATASFAPQLSLNRKGQVLKLFPRFNPIPSFARTPPVRIAISQTVIPMPNFFIRTLRKLDLKRIVTPVPSFIPKKLPIIHISKVVASTPSFSTTKSQTINITLNLTPILPFQFEFGFPLTRKGWGWQSLDAKIKKTGWREGF